MFLAHPASASFVVNNESGISEDELNGTAGTEPEDGTEAEPEDGTSENLQKDGGMEDE